MAYRFILTLYTDWLAQIMYWTKKGKILGDVEGDLTRGIENREDWKWCIPGLTVMVNGLGLGWQTSVGK